MLISWPFFYTKSVHYFPSKSLQQKWDVLMFEHRFRHEVVGLESNFFWLPLAQQISFMSSTSLCSLSDQEPRYNHFHDQFLRHKLPATFYIVNLIKHYSTILLQFVLPIKCNLICVFMKQEGYTCINLIALYRSFSQSYPH